MTFSTPKIAPAIIVTGVGGGVGQSLLKAFHGSDYRIVAVDAEPLAVGLYAADHAYVGAYAADPQFVPRLLEIARAENAQLIFPGHDVELLPLARARSTFEQAGVTPVVSSLQTIQLCDDKLATAEFVATAGYSAPRTHTFDDFPGFYGPVVLKPQFGGARSKHTYLARCEEDFRRFATLVDQSNCVIQEWISGDEYTCGSVTLNGRCHGVIAMRRTLRAGDTYTAFVEFLPQVDALVRAVAERMEAFGALNVQLKLRGNVPYAFEFNARCSGTTAARALSGFNEPQAIADYLLKGRPPSLNVRKTSILRYWKELVVDDDEIAVLTQERQIERKGRLL